MNFSKKKPYTIHTQCAESTRKRAVLVQSICRPINFEGYYIYINMIGQQLTDSCNWDQLSCFRISADRQELASFYTLEQKFETNVMCRTIFISAWSILVIISLIMVYFIEFSIRSITHPPTHPHTSFTRCNRI